MSLALWLLEFRNTPPNSPGSLTMVKVPAGPSVTVPVPKVLKFGFAADAVATMAKLAINASTRDRRRMG
jgi:hypothetical protein